MAEYEPVWRSGEDVQVLENALAAAPIPAATRRAMLARASQGLLAAGAGGALLSACGGSSSHSSQAAASAPHRGSKRQHRGRSPELQGILDVAATAEAFAVTFLKEVISRTPGTFADQFVDVLKAANESEYHHYLALRKLGGKPRTTRFWIPENLFGPQLLELFTALEVAEALFVNLYLIATTAFAQVGNAALTRYAVEISAVEAEHLVLARYAASQMPPHNIVYGAPNDIAFTSYGSTDAEDILAQLESSGVGFGKPGSSPGGFLNFSPPPVASTLPLLHPQPV